MENVKRISCLYRVSTKGQVEKDDIPMQREYCREFASRQPQWEIVDEKYEKGVSGFKKSASERDAIQELQRDAVEQKFDVLLVYMFDRLGRRDDETPFIVEWFAKNGIEVWSAVEGQQRFDNHVDKLLNYIRYWQASGERVKTSVRTKTRLAQLTENGLYTGGKPPYGYCLENHGRTGKKGRQVYDLVIDPEAAKVVQLIFYKYVREGMGSQRISRYLHEEGITRADGRDFPPTSINHMLKNRIYTGYFINGDAQSGHIPELEIIDQGTFDEAQKLMLQRITFRGGTPIRANRNALMLGRIFCGHCGNPLTISTSGRNYIRKDGTVRHETRARYQCHYKVRHPGKCDGRSCYGVPKVDDMIETVVRYQFSRIRVASADRIMENQKQKSVGLADARMNILETRLNEKRRELEDLKAETIRVIRGESKLSSELLNELLEKTTEEIQALSLQLEGAEQELEYVRGSFEVEQAEYDKILNWAHLYDGCSFDAKKMIVSQFIKSVFIYSDHTMEITFNVSFEEFQQVIMDDNEFADTNESTV